MDKNINNLYWHSHSVTAEDRWEAYGYKSCVRGKFDIFCAPTNVKRIWSVFGDMQ